jgi:hypothetical protein
MQKLDPLYSKLATARFSIAEEALPDMEAWKMGDARHHGALVRNDTRHTLRRSKALIIAFHRSCDAYKLDAALRFLSALDYMLRNQPFLKGIDRQELMGELFVAMSACGPSRIRPIHSSETQHDPLRDDQLQTL